MRHLIIGAGATFAEARALGHPPDMCPPLMRDFARKTWENYFPYPILNEFLRTLGHQELGTDPRELFYELEDAGTTSIEQFMEFVWNNRNQKFDVGATAPLPPGYISGLGISVSSPAGALGPSGFWENLQYHGLGSPMQFLMIQCFYENGVGIRPLTLSQTMANHLTPNDFVLNLNYDTVFEMALEQIRKPFSYSPNKPKNPCLKVCKPHGSINMVVNDSGFMFGQPQWWGVLSLPDTKASPGLCRRG